jgi:Domain of unknown function (DUF4282)
MIATIFDFSFRSFVTLRLVKWLFVLGMVVISVAALIGVVTAFNPGYPPVPPAAIVILTPILWFLLVIALRVALETTVVLFRIAENTGEMVTQLGEP